MPYESRTIVIDHPGEDTTRLDVNDAAANASQTFVNVPVAIATTTVIGTVTQDPEWSGNKHTWTKSGTNHGHFVLNNKGEMFRDPGQNLSGPYTLVIRQTEGAPLFRFRDIDLTVTTV